MRTLVLAKDKPELTTMESAFRPEKIELFTKEVAKPPEGVGREPLALRWLDA